MTTFNVSQAVTEMQVNKGRWQKRRANGQQCVI